MRQVRQHADFEADYLSLLEWLVAEGDRGRVLQLADGLREVVRMLARFPAAGPQVSYKLGAVLRKLIFPKGPFVAWYIYDPDDFSGDLWLVRLFHARQKRPNPARWLKKARK